MSRVLSLTAFVTVLASLLITSVPSVAGSDHHHTVASAELSICVEASCSVDYSAECGKTFGHCGVYLHKLSNRQGLMRELWAQAVPPERHVLLDGMVPEISTPPPRV